ncbi:hypothetical protein C7293_29840, partial [filamentous cyanobacterium CCT1]
VPGIERLTPTQGKDWNEVLVNPEEGGNEWQQSCPELGQLWGWHGTAVALGRPGGYLSRITEVAREVAKGNLLSEKAKAAMQRDLGSVSNSLIQKGRTSVSTQTNQTSGCDLGR